MQIYVNCKKRAVDYDSGAYRETMPSRINSNKSFIAELVQGKDGSMKFVKADDGQVFRISPKGVFSASFFLNNERPYVELVTKNASGEPAYSFVFSPYDDNTLLGPNRVVELLNNVTDLAGQSNVSVDEYIDPNQLGLCPDGIASMEELEAQRKLEGVVFNKTVVAEEPYTPTPADFDEYADFLSTVPEAPISEMVQETTEEPDVNIDETAFLTSMLDQLQETREAIDAESNSLLDNDFTDEVDEPVVFDEEDPADSTLPDLLSAMTELEVAKANMSSKIEDYETFIDTSKMRLNYWSNQINDVSDGSKEIVESLLEMLQQQTSANEQLNASMRREQQSKKHCLQQLETANKKIADQRGKLDEVRRQLIISQENQRRSERFVRDARSGVQKVVENTNIKIQKAAAAVEQMKKNVEAADARVLAAKDSENAAFNDRDEAFRQRDEAKRAYNEERSHSAQIMAEFGHQLDKFTEETTKKIAVQVKRANEAEEQYAEALSKITALESDLTDAHEILVNYEAQIAQLESDVLDGQSQISAANDEAREYEDQLAEQSNEHAGAIAELESKLHELTERNDEMAREMADIKFQLESSKADKMAAYAERDSAVEARDSYFETLPVKIDPATQNFMDNIQSIVGMSSDFGSRKAKLDALDSAWVRYQQDAASYAQQKSVDEDIDVYSLADTAADDDHYDENLELEDLFVESEPIAMNADATVAIEPPIDETVEEDKEAAETIDVADEDAVDEMFTDEWDTDAEVKAAVTALYGEIPPGDALLTEADLQELTGDLFLGDDFMTKLAEIDVPVVDEENK